MMTRWWWPALWLMASFPAFSQEKRPNILFVLTDDHRADALGAAGNRLIETPHLDELARRGVLFSRAAVTTAICCVSRASLLSGQYESRHGIHDFVTAFSDPAWQQTYPALLKKAGYHIGFVGKFGVGKVQPKELFDYWACTPKSQPDCEVKDASGRWVHDTDTVARSAEDFLRKYGKSGSFCLSVSFKAPHELDGNPPTYVVQERFRSRYDGVHFPEPLTADPGYWNRFPDFFRTDQNIARDRWKPLLSTPERYQQTVRSYYQLISGVDEAVGRLMAVLRELGVEQNTVVLFMGDNGFSLGEHGLEGKWFGFEESIRVPLIYVDPKAGKHGIRSEALALNIDIAPTILARAGVSVPAEMQGKDLAGLLTGPDRSGFFYEHTFLGSPQLPKVEGIITKRYKYMRYIEHGYEEVFDLRADRHETTNLAPSHPLELERLRKKYVEWKAGVR